ncbi:MAG: flagellar motor protein MotB [Saprospiraceae bacterium]|nr:flagellar motor protein MotB [Saprospiraceae bacterium]
MTRAKYFCLIGLLFLYSCGRKAKKEIALKDQQISQLQEQLDHIHNTNSSLLDRLSDLSVISKTGAESINKSLESINQQYAFIENLTTKIQEKDSINLALVMNLKRSLSDINDQDVQVEVRGGVVYVSISDKMLFRSGSSSLTSQARDVLGKLATVINDHDDLNVLVEGHTDNVPMNTECIVDNWDLSVKRATSVVRTLQNDYYVSPDRMTAGGRSEYVPKAANDSASGRSENRRTEIIITPKLDQFFKLLEAPKLAG